MKTLLVPAGLFLGVHYWYVLAMAAKSARDAGKLTKYWTVILAPPVYGGLVLDWAFNYTFGWMFLAKPRPVLFSATVQYHYRHSDGWRLWLATFWARTLNVFDDHIR
jgi:uncharacterized membrane protein YhaH (DUF805 family)